MSLTKILKENTGGSWLIDLLNDMGYQIKSLGDDRFLGKGKYSKVYKIDNKKVLKMSFRKDNIQEIDEYKKLIGKKLNNVAEIHYAKYYKEVGIVIMEQLFLNDIHYFVEERALGEDLIYMLMSFHIDNPSIRSAETLVENILQDYDMDIHDVFIDIESGMEVCKQVFKGILELDKHNVNYNDIHSNNIMIDRKGKYKIIDFYH